MGCQSHWWTWDVLSIFQAAATAYVLLALIVPKLVGGQKNNMPAVLQKDIQRMAHVVNVSPCFPRVLSKNLPAKNFHNLLVLVFDS